MASHTLDPLSEDAMLRRFEREAQARRQAERRQTTARLWQRVHRDRSPADDPGVLHLTNYLRGSAA